MVSMKKCNYIISVVTAVIGGIILYLSLDLGFGIKAKGGTRSGTWPGVIGILLIVFAIVLCITTIKNKQKYEENKIKLTLPENKRVYVIMVVFVVFSVLLTYFGIYIAGALMIPTVMLILGEKNKKTIALVTVFTLIAIYLIFEVALKTKLPKPFWV
ncbi:MAG: tripartite tricarboxylate transporter TctB family protein [Blautia sp.]|nr:tripartite tricarboxylate transporter TctB family protein [Blautia sp.]MDY5030376.1 tripartite tricarboxylate transporter TctB family protein [Blautia sp.]